MLGQQLHGSMESKWSGVLQVYVGSCLVSNLLAFVFFHFLFLRLH